LRTFVHGDDHLLGVSSELAEYFNAHVIRDFVKGVGIDYTSSSKNEELKPFRQLKDCMYLKSHFVFDPIHNVMKAGLEKSVIQEMVSWQRDKEIGSTKMIVNTSLRYAYFWGLEYFSLIRTKIEDALKSRKIYFDLIDYIDLDNEYHKTGKLIFDF
jgi:hypothetical protein